MNSKNKGSSFERKVCKDLSLWWSNDVNDNVFYRSVSSGARFTIRQKQDKTSENQHGDLSSVSEDGLIFTKRLYVECKHYKDVDLWSIFTGKTSSPCVNYWIHDTFKIARQNNMFPLIITKQNNKPTLVISNFVFGEWFEHIPCTKSRKPTILKIRRFESDNDVWICDYDDFLKLKSKDIREWLEKMNDKYS